MKTFSNILEIKTERDYQRSQGNSVVYSLLGVLLGELDRLPIPRSQEPDKDQIYSVLKKLYESAEYLSENDLSEEAKLEYKYLKDYIKPQLTEADIRFDIEDLMLTKGCNIGMIMKHFKEYYSGRYDGKILSTIAKDMLGMNK